MTSVAATKRGYPGMQHVTMGVGVVSGGYTAVAVGRRSSPSSLSAGFAVRVRHGLRWPGRQWRIVKNCYHAS